MKKHYLTIIFLLTLNFSYSQSKIWKTSSQKGMFQGHSVEKLDQNNSEVIGLDFQAFKKKIQNTPLRGVNNRSFDKVVYLPDNKGVLQGFKILEAPVFSQSLSAKFPTIKSYIGFGTDNSGAVLRMSVSPRGVQTMISYRDKPTIYMQPLKGDVQNYIVYNKWAKNNLPKEEFICATADELVKGSRFENVTQRDANDQILRRFRLAISVNGEYTAYHGGTVAGALAAINATMTRVNAVFETDMSVTFEVQDFPALIYTDATTDPYSGSLSAWNTELQNNLTATIGNAAYDIGHLFGSSGGGGNAGCIGCVCVDDTPSGDGTEKGSGITSPSDGIPEGDTFDIDYVAHEIGHQMGANHTYSHITESTGVNSEPGSGSTIMGYAGITTSDVALNSDAYFHYQSIRQITDNVTNNRTCWQENNPISIANNPPNANAGNDYVIPQGTAYVLRGTATDPDTGDDLLYCWEGTDSGKVTRTQFGSTRTVGAMARSLPPTVASNRYIPKLSSVVSGNLTQTNPAVNSPWETVATVARDINWALTVRDRAPSETGLNGQSSFDLMKITVDDTAGPFIVTSQATAEEWFVGSPKTITWDVAGTASGAVNTPKVNVLLSIDGGLTFPIVLGTAIDNNGSFTFTVPQTGEGDTSLARIIVEGKDNIFFAMNAANFTITESEFSMTVVNPSQEICAPEDAVFNFAYNTFLGFTGTTTFSTSGLPSGTTAAFSPASATEDGTDVTLTISGLGSVAIGQYDFKIIGTSGAITKESDATFGVYSGVAEAIVLTSPSDGNTGVSLTPTLRWNVDAAAASYDVEIATDSAFTVVLVSENVSTNTYSLSGLDQTTTYFWRVKGKSICDDGEFSPTFSFTTINCIACASTGNIDYPTGTTLVQFNTIDNVSGKPNGYSDYTAISTVVKLNERYPLTVNVNTGGAYRVQVKAWIDWNQNCSFDDEGEEYDLGFAANVANGPTSVSPFSISVPATALIGSTVLRVSSKYTSPTAIEYPTSCENDFDGEVEDYTITVEEATTTIEDFAFSSFNLYPNPTTGVFTLQLDVLDTAKVSVQLFDFQARLIDEKIFLDTNTNFSERVSFQNASTGFYILKIINGNKQTTRKLFIK